MKHIVLICAGGFSANIMGTLVRKAMESHGYDGDLKAMSEWRFQSYKDPVDVILLGPQLSFMYDKIQEKYAGTDVKVAMIEMKDYGRMDAEHVFDSIRELLKDE